MSDFLLRRVLRIYPGFVVALTFSAVLTWVLCPGFWPNTGNVLKWTRDFLTDAAFLGMKSLEWPGTFARNPWAGYANGSLWTIPEEFKCYILVAVIGLFCLFKRRVLILASAGAVVALFARGLLRTPVSWGHLQVNHGEHLVSRFYSYFLAGMLIWLFRDKIRFSPGLAVVSLAGLLVAARFTPAFSLLFLPAGSYLALYMGLSKPWRFTRWTQKTDISYGVYLIALILLSGYKRAVVAFRLDPSLGGLMLAYIAASAIYNITEAGFRMLDLMWIFLLLAIVGASGVVTGIFRRQAPRVIEMRGSPADRTLAGDTSIPERKKFYTAFDQLTL